MPKRLSPLVAAVVLIGGLLLATGGVAIAAPVTPCVHDHRGSSLRHSGGSQWSFNDYFPRTATIATGGSFQFTNEGFHTATLLPPSWSVAADLDANGIVAADIDDTALNPNGTTKGLENIVPVLPVPAQGCGTAENPMRVRWHGDRQHGRAACRPAGPVLRDGHRAPGHVQLPLPGPSPDERRADRRGCGRDGDDDQRLQPMRPPQPRRRTTWLPACKAETAASTAAKVKHANGTTTWWLTAGTSDPAGRVAVLDMLPRKVTIKKGDSVVWRPIDRNEPHTVTFPPNSGLQAAISDSAKGLVARTHRPYPRSSHQRAHSISRAMGTPSTSSNSQAATA